MPRFYGTIGYAVTEETTPGVWTDGIAERRYIGDVIRRRQRLPQGEGANKDALITDMISIIADRFTLDNVSNIRYVVWRGAKWAVSSISIEAPRVILEIGGLYSGNTVGVA